MGSGAGVCLGVTGAVGIILDRTKGALLAAKLLPAVLLVSDANSVLWCDGSSSSIVVLFKPLQKRDRGFPFDVAMVSGDGS